LKKIEALPKGRGGEGQQRPTCAVVADGDGVGIDVDSHIEPVHGRVVVRRIDHDLVKDREEARHVGDLAPVHAHALVIDPHQLGVAHLGRTAIGVRPKQDVLQGGQAAVDPLRAPAVGRPSGCCRRLDHLVLFLFLLVLVLVLTCFVHVLGQGRLNDVVCPAQPLGR
jgi:hypothetical protein